MRRCLLILSFILLVSVPFTVAWSEIRVIDDAGREVVLQQPAQRIVSLSPHITELLFVAGAGSVTVGVSEYSDYPAAAEKIARISGGGGLDMEAILALRPDLVIAWESGNPDQQVKRLQSLGLTVFLSEPRRLEDIPETVRKLGELAATRSQAFRQASVFERRLKRLRKRYAQRPLVSVFYQIWKDPLMTVNGEHLISDVMHVCGGKNVFSGLPVLAPQIDVEAVLVADPDVIIIGADAGEDSMLQEWRHWPELSAVEHNRLYTIQRELLVRHTPRVLDGIEQLCEILDAVRRGE